MFINENNTRLESGVLYDSNVYKPGHTRNSNLQGNENLVGIWNFNGLTPYVHNKSRPHVVLNWENKVDFIWFNKLKK